jgi:hypothetical protein
MKTRPIPKSKIQVGGLYLYEGLLVLIIGVSAYGKSSNFRRFDCLCCGDIHGNSQKTVQRINFSFSQAPELTEYYYDDDKLTKGETNVLDRTPN